MKLRRFCYRAGVLLLFVQALILEGRAQSATITTYVGPLLLPAIGTQQSARWVPYGIAVDPADNLFVSDSTHVKKITRDGTISAVTGAGSGVSIGAPSGVAADRQGNLFVIESETCTVRKLTPDGIVSKVAEYLYPVVYPSCYVYGDTYWAGVAPDESGALFIADVAYSVIWKATREGLMTIVAGTAQSFGSGGDGGPASRAFLSGPGAIAVDEAGNLFIADTYNNAIRKVDTAGIITTFVGKEAHLLRPGGIAVDAAGNLFIADYGNHRVVKVTSSGVVSTVAGNGTPGFSGDDGPAESSQLRYPGGIAIDSAGNLFIADSGNGRVRKVTFTQNVPFAISARGGTSSVSVGKPGMPVAVGYGSIQPGAGSSTPSGLAILGSRQNGVLVSEATVQASPLIRSGRIHAEVVGPVRTGLALANPNNEPAIVSFFFTGPNGDFGAGETTIPANHQISAFFDQSPFDGGTSVDGTFTFSSSTPLAAVGMHGLINDRADFIFTTLSVTDLGIPAATDPLVFPHFADGGGWTTEILLTNPTNSFLTGTIEFRSRFGQVASIRVNGELNTSFTYAIPPRASQKLQTSSTERFVATGSVRIIPASNTPAPAGTLILSARSGETIIAEAGISAMPPGTAFRLYVETLGEFGAVGSIQAGLAVTNMSAGAVPVTLELYNMDGSFTGLSGAVTVGGSGQTALFLNQMPGFGGLETSFQGILRVSSPDPISLTGLRARYNARGDFLVATTPPVNELSDPPSTPLFFPHVVNSGGYTTQFILFNGQSSSSSSGVLQLFSRTGGSLDVSLDSTMAPPFLLSPPSGPPVLAVRAFTILGSYDGKRYVPQLRVSETGRKLGLTITQLVFHLEGVGLAGNVPPWRVSKGIDAGATQNLIELDFQGYGDPEFEIDSSASADSVSVVISFVDDLGQRGTVSALAPVSK